MIVECLITEKSRAEFVVATFVDSSWRSVLKPGDRKANENLPEQFIAKEESELQMEEDEEVYESDPEPSAVSEDSLFKKLKEI